MTHLVFHHIHFKIGKTSISHIATLEENQHKSYKLVDYVKIKTKTLMSMSITKVTCVSAVMSVLNVDMSILLRECHISKSTTRLLSLLKEKRHILDYTSVLYKKTQ